MKLHFVSTLLAVTVIAAATGCSWAYKPTASDHLDVHWDIQDPTRTSPHAELFLTDSGLWGYEPESYDEFDPQFSVGSMVELDADDHVHLFAVVDQGRWGYRLQRLDDGSLKGQLTGTLRAVTAEQADQRDDLCLVSMISAIRDTCSASHHHRRWQLYGLDDLDEESETLTIQGDFSRSTDRTGLPVSRDAVAGVDTHSGWIESDSAVDEPGLWIGIRSESAPASTRRPTVVYDKSCEVRPASSSLVTTTGADLQQFPLDDADIHPVTITASAAELGADTIVACNEDGHLLLVPMLTRPLLTTEHRFVAAPALGIKPRPLDEASPDAVSAWARASALVAAGDPWTASYWIERAVADSDENKRLALASMTTIAVGDQPERAMNVGHRMTRSYWNPANDPDYLDGLIVLLERLGQLDDVQDRLAHRQRLVDRRHRHRAGWYHWTGVRIELAERRASHGPGYRNVIEELQDDDQDGWAVAVWLILQLDGLGLPVVDDPADLTPRFAEFDAAGLWTRLLDEKPPPCAPTGDSPCSPTAYGWRSTSQQHGAAHVITRLETVGPTTFDDAHFLAEAIRYVDALEDIDQRTAFWLALSPLVSPNDQMAVNRAVVDSLRHQLERSPQTLCNDNERWRARFASAADRADEPILPDRQRQWVSHMQWWADTGLVALCTGSDEFVDAVESRADEESQWLRTTLPLLEHQVLYDSGEASESESLYRAAQLARKLGDSETCARWNLGLTVGLARTGQLEAADAHLVEASNCVSGDDALKATRDFVAGYLDFERSAGRNVVSDGSIERAVDAATRRRTEADDCIGLAPIGFDPAGQLPEPVRRIAERIDTRPAPPGEFALLTAGTVVDRGRAAYVTGLRDIRRGQLQTAASALNEARDHFRHIGHLPGLARIGLLDEVVFDARLADIADNEEFELDDGSDHLQQLRGGHTQRVASDFEMVDTLSQSETAVWAASLLIEQRHEELIRKSDGHQLPKALCNPEATSIAEDDDHNSAPVIIGDRKDDETVEPE